MSRPVLLEDESCLPGEALERRRRRIERDHAGVRVFSLPSVDHLQYGRHIELGVKGASTNVDAAYAELLQGLRGFDAKLGPELVRN